MTKQETTEQHQWKLWLENRDPDAGDTLVRMYTPLVTYHVQRISAGLPKNISREELKSLGFQGLFDALTKFDPDRDLKFDTYASFRIRGTIIDGLRKEDWLSRSLREKTKRMDEEIHRLEQVYMRSVTPEEVAGQLGMTTDEVYQTMHEQYFANVLSIDEKMNDEEESEQTFVLRDQHEETPEQQLVKSELIGELAAKIKELNDNEQLVLNLFYQEELTLTEIGEILQLSTSRISQIHSKALFKLRSLLASEITDGGIL